MEATELIYLTMHQERYEDLKQRILLTYGAKYDKEQEQEFSARMDFLTQLQEDTEALLDFQEPRLRYFFERHATGGSGHCCLATVLVSSFNDIRQEDLQQAAQAMEERWRLLSGPGFEISEISYSGLTYCRCPQDQTPPLHEQINRLECAPEFKWKIMTALCSYEASLRELLSLMEPVLELLQGELGKLEPLLEPVYAYWRTCLEGNSLEELLPRIGPGQGEPHLDRQKITVRFWRTPCNRMFLGENWGVPGEIVAYIGERLGLHHGTVSRHLSSLYRSGLVSMEKGNGRVCYYTINRKGLRRLLEVLDQVFLEEPAGPQEEEIQESLSVPGDETG